MIEVLVSLIIVALGLLGLAGLQARALTAEFESYQRTQAILLASQMVDMIRMNRANKGSYMSISDATDGTGFIGTDDDGYEMDCDSPSTSVIRDLCLWNDALQGTSETKDGNAVGAMIGARGCILYDAATEIPGTADSGIFTVAVAWQGNVETVPPSINCANGLYGSEARRRVVSLSFRLADLN